MNLKNIYKIISVILLLLIGFIGGYIYKGLTEKNIISSDYKEVINVEVPKCSYGRCPEYVSIDVDGDPHTESVVIVPVAMTQGAGQLWVVDEGKVIWKSESYMRIGVDRLFEEDTYGFVLVYSKEPNSNKRSEIKYIYENGQFREVANY